MLSRAASALINVHSPRDKSPLQRNAFCARNALCGSRVEEAANLRQAVSYISTSAREFCSEHIIQGHMQCQGCLRS